MAAVIGYCEAENVVREIVWAWIKDRSEDLTMTNDAGETTRPAQLSDLDRLDVVLLVSDIIWKLYNVGEIVADYDERLTG